MSIEAKTEVTRILSEVNVTFDVKYVCERDRDNWKCDEWTTVFSRGKVRAVFPFFTGLGHRKQRPASPITQKLKLGSVPVAPHAADVLHSLLSDASAADQSFSDWCADLGYDDDSIKAFNTYQECCRSAKQLRELFDYATLQKLQEALQDY